MIAMGLDGCRTGWVIVKIGDGSHPQIAFINTVSELTGVAFDRAAFDIPIGLPDIASANAAGRICDSEARTLLKPHSSRVFTGARHGLWNFPTAAEANGELKRRGQPGVSLQLWHIMRKVMEIDTFARANRDLDLRETHPELVFLRLNGGKPLDSKKIREGINHRRTLLTQHGFDRSLLDHWLTKTRIGHGATGDDVLDACACAIAARDFDPGFRLPAGEPPRDIEGLPMQIWY
jgi:predicted RNase H-like nuclease